MKKTLFISKKLFLVFTFFFSLYIVNINAQSGSLDSSFATNGKNIVYLTDIMYSQPTKLAVQSDGKIILGGASSGAALIRYFSDGRQDSSFGIGEKYYSNVPSLFIQKDDKILIADNNFIFRYMPDGKPDSSFGVNGVYEVYLDDNEQLSLAGVTVDPAGKIVAGGTYFINVSSENFYSYPYAIRLTKDGELDESFGNSGVCIIQNGHGPSCHIKNIALGKNGKIALVGDNAQGTSPSTEVFIAMIAEDGKVDSTFNDYQYGYAYTNVGVDGETATNAYIKDDGKILVTGSSRIGGFDNVTPQILLIQYNPDGSLDENFGIGGFTEASIYSKCYGKDMAVQQNGKILITGQCIKKSGASDFLISRFLPNGSLDSSFGQSGFNLTDFGFNELATCVAIKKDGDIVTAGGPLSTFDTAADILMCSYIGDPVKPEHPLITKIKTWIRRHILNLTDTNPNTAYYTIEQQTSNGRYKQIASLNATSANQYSYTLPPSTNETTYRIKAVNKDNSFTYTQPIQDISDDAATISVSPNPATNTLNISGLQQKTKYEVQILNKQGIPVVSSVNYHPRLNGSFGQVSSVNSKINISTLQNGIYFLKIKDDIGNQTTLKFIKQ